MKRDLLQIDGYNICTYSLNTVVVGSGAAGLNAAKRIKDFGQRDLVIITEGLKRGTSRNTGSDKQTYYKLSLSGKESDSVYDMARTLFEGGAMHGDIALTESALSLRSFFHLVEIGVPFPHTTYGEYLGYKTDHDPRRRGTSIGPLTSHCMTEKLETEVRKRSIKIFSGFKVVGILSNEGKSLGLIALDLNNLKNKDKRFVLFNAKNTVFATGGPAKIYSTSVYPPSQTGATGVALEAGVRGRNLTESQYGLASIKFRWNLSGTYQQVLPRYLSTDRNGNDQRDFLKEYFPSLGKMLDAIFLKGYQWPFDPLKVKNYGSSIIDILVYHETVKRGRRVWLDFTTNPRWDNNEQSELDFSCLSSEAYSYLKKSDALFGKPIDRLRKMNQPAIDLYRQKGIDLEKEKLEIAVCAQHNNGGLAGNKWWESNLKNFFPVGEVNGSHGVYRPGGSALNSGQVGSLRAAEYITNIYHGQPLKLQSFAKLVEKKVVQVIRRGEKFLRGKGKLSPIKLQKTIQEKMTECGGHIRQLEKVRKTKKEIRNLIKNLTELTLIDDLSDLSLAFENYDLLLTQFVYLAAIEDYIAQGGRSRGSYMVIDPQGEKPLPELGLEYSYRQSKGEKNNLLQEVTFCKEALSCQIQWVERRSIPEKDYWFENEWKRHQEGKIYI